MYAAAAVEQGDNPSTSNRWGSYFSGFYFVTQKSQAETFFSTMKNELIHLRRFTTRDEVREAIFEYVEIFYNRRQRHQSLGYMTPEAYLNQYIYQQTAA
ncbi:IS3 family transposase [Heliobacterium chlorum]|uniref:IS3 family transposase n=1 Tax=Heliobacterium chlorum TaxID=2698 RepID=A0ABR7T7D7_HELCL|nr:IS3 family transposase [Heliobacterium chlorum]